MSLIITHYFFSLFSVPFVSIPPPAVTRWNTICLTLEVVVRLKRLLKHVKEMRTNRDEIVEQLQMKIPSDLQIEFYELILPILQKFMEVSKAVSQEKVPTIHLVVTAIGNLTGRIRKVITTLTAKIDTFDDQNPDLDVETKVMWKAVRTAMQLAETDIRKRFPQNGTTNHYFALAHVLDPVYRGIVLERQGTLTGFWQKLVDDHPTTQQNAAGQPTVANPVEDVVVDEDDIVMSYLLEKRTAAAAAAPEAATYVPPLRAEITMYESMAPVATNTDILTFWRDHAQQLPLLAELAR